MELCVGAVSEQHMGRVALLSWGLLVRPLSEPQRAVAPAGAFRSIKAAFDIFE